MEYRIVIGAPGYAVSVHHMMDYGELRTVDSTD